MKMFYEPELMREVYSKYLNGVSIDDITFYIVFLTDWHKIRNDDVDYIIDLMNKTHL